MRITLLLLLLAGAGLIAGAWLIGRWAVGLAVIVDSFAIAGYALIRDDGKPPPPGVLEPIERWRRSA